LSNVKRLLAANASTNAKQP